MSTMALLQDSKIAVQNHEKDQVLRALRNVSCGILHRCFRNNAVHQKRPCLCHLWLKQASLLLRISAITAKIPGQPICIQALIGLD